MGNIPPSPATTSDPAGAASSRNDASSNRSKGYEPSQHQVDCLYDNMIKSYTQFCNLWYGMDEEMLLSKLQARFRKEHPEFFLVGLLPAAAAAAAATSNGDEEQGGGGAVAAIGSSTTSTTKKRKLLVDDGVSSAAVVSPIIRFHGLRIPREIIAHVASYCDRSSLNNLGLTSKSIHQTIQDRRLVRTIPWPSHCPWPKHRRGCLTIEFISDKEMNRIAVIRTREEPEYSTIEIWDRFHGLIGEVQLYYNQNLAKPFFSPDGQLLILTMYVDGDYGDGVVFGLRVVQLPLETSKKVPIIVSEHPLDGLYETSMGFVDNDTIAATDRSSWGIKLWKVIRDDNNRTVSLSFSRTILRGSVTSGSVLAPFISNTKTILAIVLNPLSENSTIIFHDLTSNQSISKTPEGAIYDLNFSSDGLLVVSLLYGHHRSGFCVFDCEANIIGEVGQPRYINSPHSGEYGYIHSFSADGTKFAARFYSTTRDPSSECHIIDLQGQEVISYSFPTEDTPDNPVWNSFVN